MPNKKITDLSLISAIADTTNLPVDDTIETYRATAAQLETYLNIKLRAIATTITGAGTTLTTANRVVLLDPTSAGFTQAIPALSGFSNGQVFIFKNIATNGNTVVLDPSGSETIDGSTTLTLGSSPVQDAVSLIKTSAGWLII